MRVLTDYYTNHPVTLQTWEVIGSQPRERCRLVAGGSLVRDRASGRPGVQLCGVCNPRWLQRPLLPRRCDDQELRLGRVRSSAAHSRSSTTDGNVGTNGNLAGVGNTTTINGTLSTPRAGVGDCTTDNVTAATISGWATVEEGLVTLPQPITLPTPPPPSTPPPTSNVTFNDGAARPTRHTAPQALTGPRSRRPLPVRWSRWGT